MIKMMNYSGNGGRALGFSGSLKKVLGYNLGDIFVEEIEMQGLDKRTQKVERLISNYTNYKRTVGMICLYIILCLLFSVPIFSQTVLTYLGNLFKIDLITIVRIANFFFGISCGVLLAFCIVEYYFYKESRGFNTVKKEIEEKQKKIFALEKNIRILEDELTESEKNGIISENLNLQQQIFYLKKQIELTWEIEKAQMALANSLQSADNRIQEYNQSAKRTGRIAVELMGLDLLIIALFWFHYENFIPLFEKLGAWSLTLFSFPVIVMLTIAITLLRHQKKLLDEVRHYSAEKRQIELYSGLLKASQHAAAGLNDPQKSAEYVQETFTAIRNRILSEQPYSNNAASASEKEDYGLEAIVKIIADLAAKNVAVKNDVKK